MMATIHIYLSCFSIQMAFYVGFRQIIEAECDLIYKAFKEEFDKVATAALSLPINIPGTNYYQGLQVCN